MALEKSWYTTANYALDGTRGDTAMKHAVWWMKAFLTGGLGATDGKWTVVQSCSFNGTSHVVDTTDQWGASFDGTKIVSAPAGSNHSWIVLQSPTMTMPGPSGPASTNWYFVIDYVRSTSPANENCARFYLSKVAPTGGTTSAMPTASDQWSFCPTCKIVNSSSQQMPFHKAISSNTLPVTGYRMSGSLSSDGDFIFYSSVDGFGYQYTFGFFAMKDARALDQYPVLTYYGLLAAGNVTDGTGWMGSNGILANWTTPFRSRTYDGSAEIECFALYPGYNAGSSGWVFLNDVLYSANPYGTYDDFPLYVAAIAQSGQTALVYSAKPSVKGRLPDMKQGPRSLANGATAPTSAPYEHTKLGCFWLPWVSSSQPIL